MKEKMTNPEFWPSLGCKLIMVDKGVDDLDVVVVKDLICEDVFSKILFSYVTPLAIHKFLFKKRVKYFDSDKFKMRMEELSS